MIQAGRRSDGLFDLADLYPTVLGLAGFDYLTASRTDERLQDRYLYGIDQTSFLLADDGSSNRRSVLYWYMTNFAAVRMDEFKAHRMVSLPAFFLPFLSLSTNFPCRPDGWGYSEFPTRPFPVSSTHQGGVPGSAS